MKSYCLNCGKENRYLIDIFCSIRCKWDFEQAREAQKTRKESRGDSDGDKRKENES